MSSGQILFSVIVPVYNVQNYINECLDSIVTQIAKCNFKVELLLIDDGSTDRSGEICDQYQACYPEWIRVYHNENQGLLLTRRFGFQRARGKYIVNCDSDDKLADNYFNTIFSSMCGRDYDVILFNAYKYENGKTMVPWSDVFTDGEMCELGFMEIIKAYFLSDIPVTTSICGKVYKRECLDLDYDYQSLGYINQGEDTLQSAEIYSRAEKFLYLNKCLYFYRMQSGMTAKSDPEFYNNWKKIFYELQKYQKRWKLEEFDELFAVKYFRCIGRAITQSKGSMTYAERKHFLTEIRQDSLFLDMSCQRRKIAGELKLTYRILIPLLYYKMYGLMELAFIWDRICRKLTKKDSGGRR